MQNKRRPGRPSGRRIRIIELDKTVSGYAEAAREIKGNRGCIYLCLNNGVSRKTHKGFSFEFTDDSKKLPPV